MWNVKVSDEDEASDAAGGSARPSGASGGEAETMRRVSCEASSRMPSPNFSPSGGDEGGVVLWEMRLDSGVKEARLVSASDVPVDVDCRIARRGCGLGTRVLGGCALVTRCASETRVSNAWPGELRGSTWAGRVGKGDLEYTSSSGTSRMVGLENWLDCEAERWWSGCDELLGGDEFEGVGEGAMTAFAT